MLESDRRMRSCLLPLFRQQALECACALANCAEVNRGLASCCLGNDSDRMEIGSQEEKIGSNQQEASRNNVVDFDFLFEFSPERRAEADPHFIQVSLCFQH